MIKNTQVSYRGFKINDYVEVVNKYFNEDFDDDILIGDKGLIIGFEEDNDCPIRVKINGKGIGLFHSEELDIVPNTTSDSIYQKSHIEIEQREMWIANRKEEISNAIKTYLDECQVVPIGWIEEFNWLMNLTK